MLISMPTGTSTILGAFQAIWLSFLNRTNSALTDKILRKEKFTSEIFHVEPMRVYVASRKNSRICACRPASKPRGINRFGVVDSKMKADLGGSGEASSG
jgi:hypothetical protein